MAQDSVKQERSYVLEIKPRVNSTGHFPYSGGYINRNLNGDLNVYYQSRQFGFFVFKSWDLEDRHSIVNYLQTGIFKRFATGERFEIRIFGGYVFSQSYGFSDSDSDIWGSATVIWRASNKLKLENSTLFGNVISGFSTSNRLRTELIIRKFKIESFLWFKPTSGDQSMSVAGSVMVTFPPVHFTDKLRVETSFALQTYFTDVRPDYAMAGGSLFTVAVPIDFSRQ